MLSCRSTVNRHHFVYAAAVEASSAAVRAFVEVGDFEEETSLWMCAALALAAAVALAGCGKTTYFAGRNLPPSGLTNRVLIAIQNPSALSKGLLQFVDAYYDIRSGYTDSPASFSISGYQGALPITIQNMPEEEIGAVYGSGDGSFDIINYAEVKNWAAQSPASMGNLPAFSPRATRAISSPPASLPTCSRWLTSRVEDRFL